MGTHRIVLSISKGSSWSLDSKRQSQAYIREVHHVLLMPSLQLPAYVTVSITFHAEDWNALFYRREDAFVFSTNVNGVELHRILIDGSSSADILFSRAFDEMGLSRSQLVHIVIPLGEEQWRRWGRSRCWCCSGMRAMPIRKYLLRCHRYHILVQRHLRKAAAECLLRGAAPQFFVHEDAGHSRDHQSTQRPEGVLD